jgi:hypothetical protein
MAIFWIEATVAASYVYDAKDVHFRKTKGGWQALCGAGLNGLELGFWMAQLSIRKPTAELYIDLPEC